MGYMNRMHNISNPRQGDAKKVLIVCSAGILRSPTAAVVLASPPYNYNTRAAGITNEFALIAVDQVLVAWADEIICMEGWHAHDLKRRFGDDAAQLAKKIVVLNIPDDYRRMQPELVDLIMDTYGYPEVADV